MASLPVDESCHSGPQASGGNADAPAANCRSPRTTLKPEDHWSINFDSATEKPLFCTFRIALRKWNCDERWLIKGACIWERHRGSILRPGHQVNPNPQGPHLPCPKRDSKNSVGKPIYQRRRHLRAAMGRREEGRHLKPDASIREDDPAFYDPTSPFRFSVANHFNNTVKIQCDVVSEPVFLEASRGPESPNPKWEYEIHSVNGAGHTYSTWTCNFEVLGTMLQRGGVQIWSPQPEVNTWIRTPYCIDCSWKLDAAGLWLDDRSCYTSRPVWSKEHIWDSVANVSTMDEMDWSPYYYPLKRSSHVHHVY